MTVTLTVHRSPDGNADGITDAGDFGLMAERWRLVSDSDRFDLNGDRMMDIADVAILFSHWSPRV